MKQYSSRTIKNRGQLLLEVLVAIGLIAMIALIVLTALQTGPKTTQTANVQSRATELAREAQEIVRDIAGRDWDKICDSAYTGCEITSGSPYHAEIDPTSTEWILAADPETKTLADINYTRSVVIDNVCRDNASGAIVACGTPDSSDDPSTRKITVTVSGPGAGDTVFVTYLSRWGKKDAGQSYAQNCAAFQTDWSGGVSTTASTTGTVPCASASDLGNLFGNAWYKLTATSSSVTSTEGMEFQKIPGSLFMEPQP